MAKRRRPYISGILSAGTPIKTPLLTLNWKNENLVNIASIMADTDAKLSYPVYLIGHRNKINLPRVKAVIELVKQMMTNS